MKKLFATSLFIAAFAANAMGQSLSAGIRTGASCWMQRAEGEHFKLEAMPGQHISWDQEVFVRREGKGRWAFESSIAHSRLSNSETDSAYDRQPFVLNTNNRMDNFEFTLSVQRDITCACMQACPMMRRFKSYAGFSLTPSVTRIRTSYESNGPLIDLAGPQTNYGYDVWTGLSHTVVYKATQHLAISSVVEGRIAPATLFSSSQSSGGYSPATRFSIRLGAAYRF